MGSSRRSHILLLLIVVYCCFFFRLGVVPLLDPDEARYTYASRNMVQSGDYVVPRWNGENRLQKPILFYWLQAAGLQTIADEEYAARLPSALGAACIVWLLYWFGRRRWGELYGLLVALGFALFPLTIALSRLAITDMTLAMCVTASVLWFLSAFRERRPGLLIAAYGALGAALLTKGPVAFLFVIPALIPFWASARMRKAVAVRYHLLGLATTAAVLLPWLVLVTRRVPNIWSYWILDETVGRVLTDVKHRHIAWWFYVPSTVAVTFPVCLCFFRPSLWKRSFRSWCEGRLSIENRALVLWAVVPLLFFSFSRSQLWTYGMPALPPIALLVAPIWYNAHRRIPRRGGTIPQRVVWTCVAAAVLLMSFFLSPLSTYVGQWKSAEGLVRIAGLSELPDDFVLISCGYTRYPALLYYANREIPGCKLDEAVAAFHSNRPTVVILSQRNTQQFPCRDESFLLTASPNGCVLANREAMERIRLSGFRDSASQDVCPAAKHAPDR
ncbi:MAG: glycosyltransferase family 39 protein [bacterium]